MAKTTTKEMIALIDADIKFALEIGDKEYAALMKEAKAKLLDEVHPTRHEEYAELFGMYAEYAELFGKQLIFLLTNLLGYGTIKIMKRDFWSGNHPLGHMTLLVSLQKGFR